MISPRVIRFACLVLVGLGAARAEEPTALEHVPSVTLPITVPRRVPRVIALVEAQADPDPLRGTPDIRPETTGENAAAALAAILPERSDLPTDWFAPVEPLHYACEPRALPPCVPPPPCHPSEPPDPYDSWAWRGGPRAGRSIGDRASRAPRGTTTGRSRGTGGSTTDSSTISTGGSDLLG